MAMQPGFVDVPQDAPAPPPAAHSALPIPDPPPLRGPVLLEADAAAPMGRIEPVWEPELLRTRRAGAGSLSWVAGGLALLVVGWLVLSAVAFVEEQFRRSTHLGVPAVLVFGTALLLVLRGVLLEMRAYRGLQRVDGLRALLAGRDISAAAAREACRPWLRATAPRLPDADAALRALETASSAAEIRAVLRDRIAGPLRQAARQAGRRAALEGGAMVAITPSPALDGVLAGLRGLRLIRQVAQIYGLRPGVLVTAALLRRVAWTAAGVCRGSTCCRSRWPITRCRSYPWSSTSPAPSRAPASPRSGSTAWPTSPPRPARRWPAAERALDARSRLISGPGQNAKSPATSWGGDGAFRLWS